MERPKMAFFAILSPMRLPFRHTRTPIGEFHLGGALVHLKVG